MIQILDKSFEVYINQVSIDNKIEKLAEEINTIYKDKEVIFISILNGSFMFTSDLMKKINLECEVSFVKVSSYIGVHTSGRVDELIGLNTDISNKHVIIVEDIVDTGITMNKIYSLLEKSNPSSLKICSLLFKREAFKGTIEPHYIGFEIPNKFVIGYGLDYNEKGRNLNEIYQLKEN